MDNLDAELDAIFDKIVEIKVAPEIPKKSRVKPTIRIVTKLETCPEASTIVYLSEPSDQKDIYEISDIRDKENRSFIVVQGLSEALEIGSWIRKSELDNLKRQNRDIRFVIGGRINGE